MAPEQAAGETDRVDARADIYSLGAIVRELLPSPVPRPIAAIISKAMALEPEARFPDAAALAADLVAFRDGAAVSAFREGIGARVARLARRHRTPLVLVLAYLLMRIALLVFSPR
jgi:serine/threonine-protein kinase